MLQKESLFCDSLRTGGWVKREERVCCFVLFCMHVYIAVCVCSVAFFSLCRILCELISCKTIFSPKK